MRYAYGEFDGCRTIKWFSLSLNLCWVLAHTCLSAKGVVGMHKSTMWAIIGLTTKKVGLFLIDYWD